MLGTNDHETGSDRLCQGVWHSDQRCNLPATVHCGRCDLWFCDVHAEDDQWHACMLLEGDEGGEG